MTRKEEMFENFEFGKEEGAKYIFTEMDLGYDATEIIINPMVNYDDKITYLDMTYNDDLQHPHAPVRIVSFGWVYDLSQLDYVRNNFNGVN